MFRKKRRHHVEEGQRSEKENDKSIEPSKKRSKAEELNIIAELNITTLPLEILIGIFQYLLLTDLINTDLVSQQFHAITRDNYLWKFLFLQYYVNPLDEDNIDYRRALIERLQSDLAPPLSIADERKTFNYSYSLLFTCLKNNDLTKLRAAFPTYLYLKVIFIIPLSFDDQATLGWYNGGYKERLNLVVMEQFFSRLPQRLLINPRYQESLNYLYEIVFAEHDKMPDRHIKSSPYVFTSSVMRAVLFNQPYQTLVDLANQGQDINENFSDKLDELWNRPICLAVVLGNIEQVKYLMALGVDLDVTFISPVFIYNDCNLIKLAAYYHHHRLVVYLMEVLKDVVDIVEMCETAYIARDLDFLTCLIECGIEINFQVLKEKHAETVWRDFVYQLIKENRILLIKQIENLLSLNLEFVAQSRLPPDPFNLPPSRGWYDLVNVAAICCQKELLVYFIKLFKDQINIAITCKEALVNGDVIALNCFLESEIEVDFKSFKEEINGQLFWNDVIISAVKGNHNLLAKKLLAMDKRYCNWDFLLGIAAERGYKEIVSLLLQEGTRAEAYLSALMGASEKGHLAVVEAVVELGIQTKKVYGEYLYKSLKSAINNNHTEVAGYLFAKIKQVGCAILIKIDELIDLYFDAIIKNRSDMVMLLLKNGIDIEQKNAGGETALKIATYYGYNEMAKVLTEFRADTWWQSNMNIRGVSFYQSPALPPLDELFDAMETENFSL